MESAQEDTQGLTKGMNCTQCGTYSLLYISSHCYLQMCTNDSEAHDHMDTAADMLLSSTTDSHKHGFWLKTLVLNMQRSLTSPIKANVCMQACHRVRKDNSF